MKAKKFMVTLLASSFLLAACGSGGTSDSGGSASDNNDGGGSSSNSSYNYVYTLDIDSLDYTYSSKSNNGDHFGNFVEGLLEHDQYGNLTPSMAESVDVSDDGLTYTYHIREGVQWMDNEGNEYGQEVTANDWVTSLKHAVEVKSDTLYIVANSIKGLNDYISGKTDDFSTVGVKAVDDYTLEYTLNQPESYWNSKTTYPILFPINEDFLNSKGADFGQTSPDSILYNGPFLLTNNTAKSVIEYDKNPEYWDPDNVHIDTVKFTFFDGKDSDSLFRNFEDGNYTAARVYPNSAGYAAVEKDYGDSIIFSEPGGTTYNMTFNFNRGTYDATSKETDKQKEDTQNAIYNRNFRLAVEFAFDKKSYNAQNVGDEGAEVPLRNTLVPPAFLMIDGKPYGDTVAEKTKALDEDAFGDVDFAEGVNGYYNADKAKTYIEKAKTELEAEGVEFPIHLDLPVKGDAEVGVNQMKSLKSTIEDALGTDNVVIDIQLLSQDAYYAATFQAATGQASDFDISTASGWGPDYMDPSTYLNIYNSKNGDTLNTLGLDGSETVEGDDPSTEAKEKIKLSEYDALLDKANAITDDETARFEAYADAEAWLNNAVLQVPIYANGATPSVTKVVPFTAPYGWAGVSTNKYKYYEIQNDAVTKEQYDQAHEEWLKKQEETAKEAAETGGVLMTNE